MSPSLPVLKNAVAAKPPKAPAPPRPPSAEEANVLLWRVTKPDGTVPADPPPVVDGTLTAEHAEPALEVAGPPRVCAFLSLGATVRGLAAAIAPLVNQGALDPADPATPPGATDLKLTQQQLERALLVYLDLSLGPVAPSSWRVGDRVLLPIELTAAPTGIRWTVGRAQMRAWAATGATWGEAQLQTLLTMTARPLGSPEAAPNRPEDVEARVAARVAELGASPAAPAQIQALGGQLRTSLLANPFADLFDAVEVLRQLRRDRPADELPLVLAVLAGLPEHQARVVGWTMAGNALFRRFWDALRRKGDAVPAADKPAVAAARALLADALGLAPNGTATWYAPTERGPSVQPVDLALTRNQGYEKGAKPRYTAITYGRVMKVGTEDTRKHDGYAFTGPGASGSLSADVYSKATPGLLGPSPTPLLAAACKIVEAIAPSEGKLNATRQADYGLISIGIQQWTIMGDDELTVVLYRYQQVAPDHFDLFFGIRGISVRPWTKADAATEPGPADIDASNKHLRPRARPDTPETWRSPYAAPPFTRWGDAGSGPPDDGFATYAKLYSLGWSTGGTVEVPRPVARDWKPRYALFGGVEKPGKVIQFSSVWSGVARLAADMSPDLRAVQFQVAVFRFQRLLDATFDEHGQPILYPIGAAPPAPRYPLARLMSSQFAAAIVLDSHINMPKYVVKDIDTAYRRTQAADAYTLGGSRDDEWLMRLAVNYMAIRRVIPDDRGRRDDVLLTRHDAATDDLDPKPGTFKGWPAP
ncbi:hypothetical protein [Actinomadura atramentaria]|uniref:hypothetical protein n=1 Tax=Actinomadura atramentaria TaxID=1990 RepID=UPI000363E67F|nr:hypothetical protein [Actinomadura atramentaria]